MFEPTSGLYFIILGCLIHLIVIVVRAIVVKQEQNKISARFWILLGVAILSTIIASYGFYLFLRLNPNEDNNYELILTILSLLSAGIISGYFTFSYRNSLKSEPILPNAISLCFTLLFYFLFGSVSFYMGKSQLIEGIEHVEWLIALIMFLLFLGNLLFDFWDYLQVNKK